MARAMSAVLIEFLISENRFAEAEQAADYYRQTYKQSPAINKVNKQFLEALYWQQKDEQTLKFLEQFP